MFDILSVFLLTCFYYAAKPTLVLSIDTNELNAEHHNQIKFPTIDPNIVEDAKLTTVRFSRNRKKEKTKTKVLC